MGKPATVAPAYPHLTTDAQGAPLLAGTTMKVVELVMAQQANGWSPEELHFQFPGLSLGQIHAALSYYWDYKDGLDAEIERRYRYAEQARSEAQAQEELQEPGMLESFPRESGMRSPSTRIDSLYSEIRALVSQSAADPSLRDVIDSRRSELRQLQEQEAAEMERRYEASLALKPADVWGMFARAAKALGDA